MGSIGARTVFGLDVCELCGVIFVVLLHFLCCFVLLHLFKFEGNKGSLLKWGRLGLVSVNGFVVTFS